MAKTRSQKTPTKSPKANKKAVEEVNSPSKPSKVTKAKKVTKKAASTDVATRKASTPTKAKNQATNKEEKSDGLLPQKASIKAIAELVKFANQKTTSESDKPSLFDDEDEDSNDLFIQLTTKKYYSNKVNLKPKVIKLTNPIIDQESCKTCLIIRDQLITTNEQLEKIEAENLPTLQQIVSVKQLKTEYKAFEKRRQLFSEYDLFLVDEAVLNSMPTVLGKIFYGTNQKIPIPVKVTSASNSKEVSTVTVRNQLTKCLQSTSFLPPVGVNIVIKFGDISFDSGKLLQNLNDIVAQFDQNSLRSVSIKTNQSPSLPLYITESLYDEKDILQDKENKNSKDKKTDEAKLSTFEKGLLELGGEEEVAKILGKKLKKTKKVTGKVTKP